MGLHTILEVCIWRHQKHENANYDQFAPKFYMACETVQIVSVPNLKVFGFCWFHGSKYHLNSFELGFLNIFRAKICCVLFLLQHYKDGAKNVQKTTFDSTSEMIQL